MRARDPAPPDAARRALREAVEGWLRGPAPRDLPPPAAPPVPGPDRWQDPLIEREVPRGARLLDLGCGTGELLERLMRRKGVFGQGVEWDADRVAACVGRGVPVLQMDMDEGLGEFPDGHFDFVLLENTLQTLRRPVRVLCEMLRVGRCGIVSFPNYGHWRIRLGLAREGRMPPAFPAPGRGRDAPGIHPFTLRDFLDWADAARVRIQKGYSRADGLSRPLGPEDNLLAEETLLFLVSGG